MAIRKSVCFKEETSVTLFFLNQAPNIVLETIPDTLQSPPDVPLSIPAICNQYTLLSDSEELEEPPHSFLNFTNFTEISSIDCHFFIFINHPGEYILSIINTLHSYFGTDKIQSFFIVRPLKYTDQEQDFKVSYSGVMIGIVFKETSQCQEYITQDSDLKIDGISSAKLIPGPRGEHIWSKYVINKSFLQGFFFVGQDPVDIQPSNLCYLASIPKGYRQDYISKELFSHSKEFPIHIIFNPLEEKSIWRLEFSRPEIVRLLLKRCMAVDGKPLLALPCVDRTPVEQIYVKYQIQVSGYTNAIHPKEFIRVLSQSFGPVVELVINFEGLESLVVFQTVPAAEKCFEKKEIFLKNHKIRFATASRPYRLTGKLIHKGRYNTQPPSRPLPLVPAPYTLP